MPTRTLTKLPFFAFLWCAGFLVLTTLMTVIAAAPAESAGSVAFDPSSHGRGRRTRHQPCGKSSGAGHLHECVVRLQVPQTYSIATELCVPPTATYLVVHLVVHGTTYGGAYWDWPYRPATFSYARTLAARGYAVLVYDRLGNGGSSHPPSAAITYQAHVQTIHQLIGYLRSGAFGVAYKQVILVGHSSGSVYCWGEAAQYADEDGVIITGEPHNYNSQSWPEFAATLYPAHLDPNFTSLNLDDGYFTTLPERLALL